MFINQEIYKYVQDLLNKGYDLYTIRNNLLMKYPQNEVDSVIAIFSRQQQEAQLKAYINNQIALGFNPDIIKNSLRQSGYPEDLINSAFGASNITVKHEIHFPLKTIIILVLLISTPLTIYFLWNPNKPLLDVSISANSQEYVAGQDITYNIELINMGKSKRFDANIRYTIVDSSGKILKSYSETLAVETKTTSNGKIAIPRTLLPGRYNLNVVVIYGNNQKAESSYEFEIVERLSLNNNNNININNVNTNQNTENSTLITGSRNNIRTFGETMLLIKQQSLSNPQAAVNTCLKFSNINQKDICISDVAYSSNRINFCEQITDINKRDNCYLSFVISGNTQVCDRIYNNELKQYCEQMSIVEQMNYYYQQGNNEKILELSRKFEPAIYNKNIMPISYQNEYNSVSALSDLSITAELE
ncbi:MAG: hypothetical protein QXK76_02805 [Candidatus Woesearchaeota archaeon]